MAVAAVWSHIVHARGRSSSVPSDRLERATRGQDQGAEQQQERRTSHQGYGSRMAIVAVFEDWPPMVSVIGCAGPVGTESVI